MTDQEYVAYLLEYNRQIRDMKAQLQADGRSTALQQQSRQKRVSKGARSYSAGASSQS